MMTNQHEKFQQRWEFRRGGNDEDSSTDDSKSSSDRMDKTHNIVNHLLLHDDDEVSNSPRCHQGDKLDTRNHVVPLHSVKIAKQKVQSNKKKEIKTVAPKKSMTPLVVAKGKKKRRRNPVPKDMIMLEDLKRFADSLLRELKVAREDMFAQMRNLAASRPRMKKVKKAQNGSSVERTVKSNVTSDVSNSSEAVLEYERTENELQRGEKLNLSKKARMVLATDSDRVVSSPFLPPKPKLQSYESGIFVNDRVLGFHPNISSQTYSGSSFRDKAEGSQTGNSATLRFSGGNITASSEHVLRHGVSSNVHHGTEGEFVPLRLQELNNDQVYLASLRN